MEMNKRIISLTIIFCIIATTFPLISESASAADCYCNCKSNYQKGKFVSLTYKTDIVSTSRLSNQYTSYKRAYKACYYQRGAQCFTANGTSYTIDYSVGASFVPISAISSKLGVKISKSTVTISGTASPPATRSKPYIAPYTRKAYKVWSVKTRERGYCRHKKLVYTKYKTCTVKAGYKDSKWLLFGHAKGCSDRDLPSTVSSSSNSIFVW